MSRCVNFSILTTTKGKEKGTCVKSCEEEAAAAEMMLLILDILAVVVVVMVVEKEGVEDKEPAKEIGSSEPSL